MIKYLTALVIILVTAFGVYAQAGVTRDDIDEVASRMFCPVCENEPLDQCYNPTCIQWKGEIGDLLGQGLTPDEVIDSFVARYGEHVVGVPQDPLLRSLSFGAPIIATVLAVIIGFMTFQRWQQNDIVSETVAVEEKVKHTDAYRSQVERDLM